MAADAFVASLVVPLLNPDHFGWSDEYMHLVFECVFP